MLDVLTTQKDHGNATIVLSMSGDMIRVGPAVLEEIYRSEFSLKTRVAIIDVYAENDGRWLVVKLKTDLSEITLRQTAVDSCLAGSSDECSMISVTGLDTRSRPTMRSAKDSEGVLTLPWPDDKLHDARQAMGRPRLNSDGPLRAWRETPARGPGVDETGRIVVRKICDGVAGGYPDVCTAQPRAALAPARPRSQGMRVG